MILPLLVALVAQGAPAAPAPPNALTAAERAAGWRLLFDGRTLRGWRGLGYDSVPMAHWVIVDGTIKKIASGDVPKLPDGKLATHRAGALYDLIAPSRPTHVRPVGEWNQSKVVFRGNHGEHWLNGEKLLEFDLGTARMDSALSKSKFRSLPWFGERRRGHIILQDHGDEVYFKNIKVRDL